jgi:hypothetical protein
VVHGYELGTLNVSQGCNMQTIYLRIGTKDSVPMGAFISSLTSFLGILRDVDAAVSKDQRGSVDWEVVSLQQNSPIVIGARPSPRVDVQDQSSMVEAQIIENCSLLGRGEEPTKILPFAALKRIERLAKPSSDLGPSCIYIDTKQEAIIGEDTLRNVQQFTRVRYSGFGSIIGKLESVSVHNGREFRVWDEATRKPIRCTFVAEQEERVISYLEERARIRARGMLHSNASGLPIKMELEDLEVAAKRDLPTIDEMTGFVHDFTEGKSLKRYLEDLDND